MNWRWCAATTVRTGVPQLLPPSYRRYGDGYISVLIADRDPMSIELLATAFDAMSSGEA